mmetsp:Transcript_14423/g.34537  ORF Transcript_14423/g.34537 Transcript_14423/m.34537 type:complete len:308 (-) Transcript_14423:2067-2990(-)
MVKLDSTGMKRRQPRADGATANNIGGNVVMLTKIAIVVGRHIDGGTAEPFHLELPLPLLLFHHVALELALPVFVLLVVQLPAAASIDEGSDVMSDAASKGRNDAAVDLIPALEDRYDPPVAASIGNLDKLLSDPFVVIFDHPDVAKVHGILLVRVKASTDEDEIRIEVEQMRENVLPVRIAELYALHAWHVRRSRKVQSNVNDFAAVATRIISHASPGLGEEEVSEARILDARRRINGISGSRLARRGVEPSTLLIGEADVTGAVAVSTGEENIMDVILVQPRLVPGNMKCTDCKGGSDGSPLSVGD